MRDYLPLIRKDSMHGLAVYVKEGLLSAQDLSLENFVDFYLVFNWLYFIYCLTSFSIINHHLCIYAWLLMLFKANSRKIIWAAVASPLFFLPK